jgi:HAD superfamily hydrolase (TIGR01484 family)
MPAAPRPFAECPASELQAVQGVFTDIDDTLTCDGALMPQALEALRELAGAGVPVIAITGRPLGWSEPFARAWPLAAIVAENGAVALLPGPDGVRTEFAQDAGTRERNAARLAAVARRLQREMPQAQPARDSAGRVTDIAIDHSEFARLAEADIARVVALMQSEGLNATVSSIHVNGWIGEHDKLSGARWMVRRLYGRALDGERERWLYVGDSTNDQRMFGYFALSVGVANLLRFAAQLRVWPAYLAAGERGAGFAEVARRLLQTR